MLLLSARFVNVLLGALMAWVVLKAAKLLFPRRYAWMFTALVVFLPGNVILYSYVNLCSVCHWNGPLFPVVLQCVWIYPDDIFLLCGNDADRSGKGTKRALERDDPERSFYSCDRLCHCFVVVYSKCNSLSRGFSGKRDIECVCGTVCES